MKCQVGSIRQIHMRLISEGYNISEHALRIWVKNGVIPAIFTGHKALIAYDNVVEVLRGTTNIVMPV